MKNLFLGLIIYLISSTTTAIDLYGCDPTFISQLYLHDSYKYRQLKNSTIARNLNRFKPKVNKTGPFDSSANKYLTRITPMSISQSGVNMEVIGSFHDATGIVANTTALDIGGYGAMTGGRVISARAAIVQGYATGLFGEARLINANFALTEMNATAVNLSANLVNLDIGAIEADLTGASFSFNLVKFNAHLFSFDTTGFSQGFSLISVTASINKGLEIKIGGIPVRSFMPLLPENNNNNNRKTSAL